jgi:S1-C subfamily serine protease
MPDSPLQTLSTALSDLVAGASKHVVAVHSLHARSSGFFWSPDLIVTAEEGLADEGDIEVVLTGGERVGAAIAGRDPTTDIALLRTKEAKGSPVDLEASDISAGALAAVIGSQHGTPVAAIGAVAIAGPGWRSLRGGAIDARVELDLSLRRVAEGGLVVDASGSALGMAVFGPRRRVLVIPTATIERVAPTLAERGHIPRGYLGLGLQPVRLDDSTFGAMIMSVDPKGPAAAAGIKQGDVIASFNGRSITGVQGLFRELGPESIGNTITVSLRRAGEPTDVQLSVGERPKD